MDCLQSLKIKNMADHTRNNFKQLMEEEYESSFTLPQMMAIEQRLNRKQHSMNVAGDILDLFLPKIFKTVAGMLGGEDDRNRPAPSSSGNTYRPSEPKAPGSR
jgi:hypothetical protein